MTSPRSAEMITTDGKAIPRMKTEKKLLHPWDGLAIRGISIVAAVAAEALGSVVAQWEHVQTRSPNLLFLFRLLHAIFEPFPVDLSHDRQAVDFHRAAVVADGHVA